jgi:HK97 family phage major capsid protein
MDLSVLLEKRTQLKKELETLLTSDSYTKSDDQKSDDLLAQVRKLDQQVKEIEAAEAIEATEAKREINNGKNSASIQEMRNHKGDTAKVYSSPYVWVRDHKYDMDLGRFLQVAYLGQGKNDAEKRALDESSSTAGYTVPSWLYAEFVGRLMANSVLFEAGAKTIELKSDDNSMAKMLNGIALDYYGENDQINDSDPTFGKITWAPKKVMGLTKVSSELLSDSLNIQTILADEFTRSLALEITRCGLEGLAASDEPVGIYSYPGLSQTFSMGAAGSSFAVGAAAGGSGAGSSPYWPLISCVASIKSNNITPNAIILSSRDAAELSDLSDENKQPLQIPSMLQKLNWLDTGAISTARTVTTSTNCSTAYVGDFTKLFVGIRSNVVLRKLNERFADTDSVGFLAGMRYDVQATHEQAFAKVAGIYARGGAIT